MPLRLTPLPDEAIPTKRVSPPEWDAAQEWIEILSFLRKDTLNEARTAARKTVTVGGRTQEEYDEKILFSRLFAVQVKGWHIVDPNGAEIPYSQENLARLPWDLAGWLYGEIASCGGVLATRDLVIQTKSSGQALDFRSQETSVGTQGASEVPDPV